MESSEYGGPTSEYGSHPSCSSSEGQQTTREMEMGKMKKDSGVIGEISLQPMPLKSLFGSWICGEIMEGKENVQFPFPLVNPFKKSKQSLILGRDGMS